MLNIGIELNKQDFEYDVHSLIKAFYPEDSITMYYKEEPQTKVFDLLFVVTYENQSIQIQILKDGCICFDETAEHDFYKERKETKNCLKQILYRGLVQMTGKKQPWGTLSGIRPTKIPMKMLEEGKSNVQIAEYMRDTYYTSNEKTALSITIANRERALLKDIDYENGYSLYVGIPFCPSICLYCSFSSYPLEKWVKEVDHYLDALCKEIDVMSRRFAHKNLNTVYIGGGTPTTLSPAQLERLLTKIQESFDFSKVVEYTVEAGRPDSITVEKLQVLRKFPVTRISVNPQTMNQETLEIIGRRHTVEQTIDTFWMAREQGFDNINMDLIIGLPGEDKQKVAYTLEKIKELSPDSLTIHSLAVKRAARLSMFKDKYQEMTFENSQEIMDMTAKCAMEMQMGPYYLYRQKNMKGNFENVGYAKVDKAGIYNILIMEEKQSILALGAGASTKFVFEHGERIERVENVKDVRNYIERIDEMIQRKNIGIDKYLE